MALNPSHAELLGFMLLILNLHLFPGGTHTIILMDCLPIVQAISGNEVTHLDASITPLCMHIKLLVSNLAIELKWNSRSENHVAHTFAKHAGNLVVFLVSICF